MPGNLCSDCWFGEKCIGFIFHEQLPRSFAYVEAKGALIFGWLPLREKRASEAEERGKRKISKIKFLGGIGFSGVPSTLSRRRGHIII